MTFNTEIVEHLNNATGKSFKPCYIWMTFNTVNTWKYDNYESDDVLNLVIYG